MVTEVNLSSFIKECVDIPRFYECCTQCPNFNVKWSCPPYDFDAEEIWKSHSTVILFASKILTPGELLSENHSPDEINAISRKLLRPVKDAMADSLLKMEAETPGSLALFAGSCEICDVCAKKKGEPCLHPDRMRYSIESLGGNVEKALELYFNEKMLWAGNGRLPEYFILLGGLLK
ncbi:MAG: hypothetical protein IJS02_00060 [Bacteroidales bacterium]|nr:hypothetical protein [Bacteroidales bacterium]